MIFLAFNFFREKRCTGFAEKLLLILLLSTTFSACSLAPGLQLKYEKRAFSSEALASENYYLIPVSAKVIRDQQKTRSESEGLILQPKIFTTSSKDYRYLVQPTDVLSIIVWGYPELTVPPGLQEQIGFRVQSDGYIYFPYVERLLVAGKTTEEIRQGLRKGLADFIENPQVDVQVSQYQSQKIYISGAFSENGFVPITDTPLYLMDAIQAFSPPKPLADVGNLLLTRGEQTVKIDLRRIYEQGDLTQNYLLKDKDVIYLPDQRDNRVFIMGATGSSIQFLDKGQLSLASALQQSGGFDPNRADPRQLLVIRGQANDKPIVYYLDASRPDTLILTTEFQLMPRDIVYVGTADLIKLREVLSLLTPIANTAFTIDNLGNALD